MRCTSLAAVLAGLFLASSSSLLTAETPGEKIVELVRTGSAITASTTFDVRFADAMIPASQATGPAAMSPLRIVPPLEGKFWWKSERHGTFIPDRWPIASKFTVTLSPGLKNAAGVPVTADWSEVLETPGMEVRSVRTLQPGFSRTDASVQPRVSLVFNVNVDPAAIAPFIRFRDAGGQTVEARIDQEEAQYHMEHGHSGDFGHLAPWPDQGGPGAPPAGLPKGAPPRNQITVTPATPLPPGSNWRLHAEAGLPAAGLPLTLAERREHVIGDVKPFVITSVRSQNYVETGKRIVIEFSKPLDAKVKPATMAEWIGVTPAPANLAFEGGGRMVELTGDFAVGVPHRVSVAATIPAIEPVRLAAGWSAEVKFEAVKPRLYFEEFSTHQLSAGRRAFHLRGVNVPKVRVTARLFTPETAAKALTAWQSYHKEVFEEDEFYKRVDMGDAQPAVHWQKEYTLNGAMDESKQLALDWNEMLGAGRTGVALLEAEAIDPAPDLAASKRPGTQALVQLTDLGAVWKTSRRENFVYIFSLAGGQGLPDSRVELLDAANKSLGFASTDAAGCVRLPASTKARWLHVRHGADQHIVPFGDDRESLSFIRYRLNAEGDEDESDDENGLDGEERKFFLFTERGAYRPGDTVYLKGIVRDFSTGVSRVPEGDTVTVAVADARGRTILEQTLTLSAHGSFSLEVPLSGTALGFYEATVTSGNAEPNEGGGPPSASHGWQVQEFVPNAFEIAVATPRQTPVLPAEGVPGGVAVELPVSAKYYMGKPLSRAELKWTVRAADEEFAPAGFDEWSFCDGIDDYRLRRELGREAGFSEQGEMAVAEGLAPVALTIPINLKSPQPREGRLICEITDLNQQTVSTEQTFTVHASDFYLGLRDLPEVVRAGAPLALAVTAVDQKGIPLPAPVAATVRVTRIDWQTNRVQGAGRSDTYQSEPRFTRMVEQPVQTAAVAKTGRQYALTPGGAPTLEIKAGEPGQYLLEVLAQDAAGRPVATATTFHVYGAAETVWNYRNPMQIDLVLDKEEYKVGDRAVLLVKTPISGDALVTVERENVRRSWITKLEGNAPSVEVSLEDADAPNVYVSVMLLRGSEASPRRWKAPEYRVGYARLKVARPASKLSVYVRPDASRYQPGEMVTVTAEVLDHLAQAAPGAEVTLYAVDEGVLSLTGYETPDPLPFFQQERALGVTTGLTLPQMLAEDPEEMEFANKGYLIGDKGGEDRVRRNFLACAFWSATLKADAHGKVIAKFAAPDGLTRYRLMAVAQTQREQFGSGEGSFEIHKPVMIEPAPPRFANVGDELRLRAVVHNTTTRPGDAEVSVTLDATAAVEGPATRRITVAAGASVAVDFPVRFQAVGDAEWTWAVRFQPGDGTAASRDAAVTKLKVHHPAPLRRSVQMVRVDAADANLLDRVPPDLLDGIGTVQVSLTNSRVLELGEAIRSLLHYPYGCVEQTTSSMLPWLTLRDLRGGVPDLRKTDEQIRNAVEKGVDRLFSMQTDGGGLAYWPGSTEPMLWGSAYAAIGIAMAQGAGYTVPDNEWEMLCAYLSKDLRGLEARTAAQDLSPACMAVYALALAGKAEAPYHEVLFAKRAQLSLENRALLALAIQRSGGPEESIRELLTAAAPALAGEDFWFGSQARGDSMRLLAWCRFEARNPAVERLLTDLIGGRRNGHWLTTQGNAWALLALGEYVAQAQAPLGDAAGTLTWNGAAKPFTVSRAQPLTEVRWPLAAGGGGQPVRLSNPTGATLFAEVRVESRSRVIEQPRQESPYRLSREYQKLGDDNELSDLGEARVGDRVLVTLRFAVDRAARYVAIEDPLPSVFEAVNPEFETQAAAGEELATTWASDFHELREDRALFFKDYVGPGNYTIRYLARVRAAGVATAPAARIEEMYHPDRSGQSATRRVTSRGWE